MRTVSVLVRLGVAAAVVLTVGFGAIPAIGQSASAPPPPTSICPNPAVTTDTALAGYGLSSQVSGVHTEIDSKGLLPVGDAAVGNIVGTDVPFARIGVSGGPLIDSLSSPIYPGDTAAHLGTILALEGLKGVPNEPVLAESDFPASPGHAAHESFNGTGGATVPLASADSTATDTGATAVASVASSNLGGGPATLTAASSNARSAVDLGTSCADITGEAVASGINIAGVVNIAGVTGYAAAKSDGSTATPRAELHIGRVTVAGLDAYIDQNGVHLASQQPVGAAVVAAVNSTLHSALTAGGISVTVLSPHVTQGKGKATADSGAVLVTIDQTIPQLGSPPAGTAPLPTHLAVAYGRAQVQVAGTSVPAAPVAVAPDVTPATDLGSTIAPPVVAPESGGSGPSISPPVSRAIPPPAPTATGRPALAASGPVPPGGSSVPIGWLIIGLAASIIAIGPLLGYARWQLLEGRI